MLAKLSYVASVALIFSPVATPAFAQTAPAQQPQQSAKKVPDPNEVVCERQQDSSSRIASKRICMTRSQWAEQRRMDRQDVEKAQMEKPMDMPH